jgi:hypothetical protein
VLLAPAGLAKRNSETFVSPAASHVVRLLSKPCSDNPVTEDCES